MAEEKLDLSTPVAFASCEEQAAAIAFFNAALRAEESGSGGPSPTRPRGGSRPGGVPERMFKYPLRLSTVTIKAAERPAEHDSPVIAAY
jgi:hypothetical protein